MVDRGIHRCNFLYHEDLLVQISHCRVEKQKPGALYDWHTGNLNDNVFLFVLKGSAVGKVNDRMYTLGKNDLLFIQQYVADFSVRQTSSEFEALVIFFELYTHNFTDLVEVTSHTSSQSPHLNTPHTKLSIGLPEHIHLEEYGFAALLLERIIRESREKQPGYHLVIQSVLTEFLIECFRKDQNSDLTLAQVSSVCLSSWANNETPMPAGQIIWISNIELWNEEPSGDILLGTMTTGNVYVTVPTDDQILSYAEDADMPYGQAPSGRIIARETTPYYIYFFQALHIKPIDLRPYKNTCVLKFAVRSNRTGSIGINLVNQGNYFPLSYIFPVEEADAWIDIRLPLYRTEEDRISSVPVQKALQYIKQNYMFKIKNRDISAYAHINSNYLASIFKQQTGTTIHNFILSYRIQMAKKFLLETDDKIEEVAVETGFYDLPHFAKAFKEKVGLSPIAFRNQSQNKNEKE